MTYSQQRKELTLIRTVCLNPALDKTVQVPNFKLDAVSRITEMRVDAGGKGINVSKVIKELGGNSVAYALLAGNAGAQLERMVKDAGIEVVAQYAEGETRTNLKVVDAVNHTNTDINEPGPVVTDADLTALLDRLVADIEEGDTVVLAGSIPAGAPVDTYATWTKACKEAGAKVFLDASPTTTSSLASWAAPSLTSARLPLPRARSWPAASSG